jgi:Zn-dependent metalloprotease
VTPFYARHKRTTLAIATAVAAGALITAGMTTGASAQSDPAAGKAEAAAVPVALTPAARTALIKQADATAAETADEIGLGAQEKLVVRDVVKNADGTTHTRYERTYAGLPVLGGDLVVHESESGRTEGVTRATKATIEVADLTADITRTAAEKQALKAAQAEGSTKSAADKASRPSRTRPSSAASSTTAPRRSCTSSPTRRPARSCTSGRPSRPARATASTTAP